MKEFFILYGKIIILAIIIVGFIIGFSLWLWPKLSSVPSSNGKNDDIKPPLADKVEELREKITYAAGEGDWQTVDELILQVRIHAKDDEQYRPLEEEQRKSLDVKSEIHFPGTQDDTPSLIPTLRKGDYYYLLLGLPSYPDECYLYVFEGSTSGEFKMLFPNNDYSELRNPVYSAVRLPESYSKKFELNWDYHSTRFVYILASFWAQKKLERLVSQGVQANKDEIKNILKSAEENTPNIPGLSFGVYQFNYKP